MLHLTCGDTLTPIALSMDLLAAQNGLKTSLTGSKAMPWLISTLVNIIISRCA